MSDDWFILASALGKMLAEVDGVGVVYVREDYPLVEDELNAFLKENPDTEDINAWVVTRVQVNQNKILLPPSKFYRVHGFTIRGYQSVASDSYLRFNSLVDVVLTAFTPPRRLDVGDAVLEDLPEASMRYTRIAEGLPLLHQVDIRVPVKQLISIYS